MGQASSISALGVCTPFEPNTCTRLTFVKQHLLDRNELSEASIARAMSEIKIARIDDADLFFQATMQESWQLTDGTISAAAFKVDHGVGIRAVVGEKTAFAYSADLSANAISNAAKTVRVIARYGQGGSVGFAANERMREHNNLFSRQNAVTAVESFQKVALLQRVDQLARAMDPRVVNVSASLGLNFELVLVENVNGLRAADIRPLLRLKIQVIAQANGRRETGMSDGGGRIDFGQFDGSTVDRYTRDAVDAALRSLDSISAPTGEMTVVLGSGWPGVMVHEAVGHGLEGDFNRKGTSAFANRIGQRVAARGVSIVDDGTLPGSRGSLHIDDEGQPTQRNVLIEDGVLVGYMQDRLNARLMKQLPTGNGRRQSFAHLPTPRMTNTFICPGSFTRDEVIGSVRRGVYVARFDAGQVDVTSGRFVFSGDEAYLIENGQIKCPIKGASIVGDGRVALNHVTMVANDLKLDTGGGVCLKARQHLPVGVGQPTLRIEKLTLGGTS